MFKHGSLYYTSKIHIHIFMHNVCKNLFKYAQENYKKREKRMCKALFTVVVDICGYLNLIVKFNKRLRVFTLNFSVTLFGW